MNKSRQNGSPTIATLVAAALIAGGLLVGCSGASQDQPASAPPVAAADQVRPDVAAGSGPAISEPASRPLPEGYPADVAPIYPSATVTHAFELGSGAMLNYMITAETSDSVDVVAASLADDYKSRGANVSQTPLNEEGVGQVAASKDGYGIIMTYTAGDRPGITRVTYSVRNQRGSR